MNDRLWLNTWCLFAIPFYVQFTFFIVHILLLNIILCQFSWSSLLWCFPYICYIHEGKVIENFITSKLLFHNVVCCILLCHTTGYKMWYLLRDKINACSWCISKSQHVNFCLFYKYIKYFVSYLLELLLLLLYRVKILSWFNYW